MMLAGLLTMLGLAFLTVTAPARALLVAPPPPGPERIAKVDCIVVGRIVAVEDKDVEAGGQKYRVAVIKVSEALKAPADTTTLRLGFTPPVQPNQPNPAIKIRPSTGRVGQNYQVGQDGLFFLTRHPKEMFYTAPMYYDFVSSQNDGFAGEVGLTRYTVKFGEKPAAGLKSDKADERFYAAALLVQKYRTFRGGAVKSEPIDAGESRLILKAILEGDWKQSGQISPLRLFYQLGLTAKDGWTPPRNIKTQEDVHKAAQAWLREHGETFRIQRVTGGATTRPPIKIDVKRD
jgi:hypothetical protein